MTLPRRLRITSKWDWLKMCWSRYVYKHVFVWPKDGLEIPRQLSEITVFRYSTHFNIEWQRFQTNHPVSFAKTHPNRWSSPILYSGRKWSCVINSTTFCKFWILSITYNRYQLFSVYAKLYDGELLQSIDDHLNFLHDYLIVPKFMRQEEAIHNFLKITERRNDKNLIATAMLLK